MPRIFAKICGEPELVEIAELRFDHVGNLQQVRTVDSCWIDAQYLDGIHRCSDDDRFWFDDGRFHIA